MDSTCIYTPKPTMYRRHSNRQTKSPLGLPIASKTLIKVVGKGQRNCNVSSSHSMTKQQKNVQIVGTSRLPKTTKNQMWDIHILPNIQETYGSTLAKCRIPPRPIASIQRDAKPPLHHSQNGKDVNKSHVLQQSATGKLMPYFSKSRDALRIRGGRGTNGANTSGRSSSVERCYSKVKKVEMPFNYSSHNSPLYEKSSVVREGFDNRSKINHGSQIECNKSTQEVTLVKSYTHLISKHNLAKHVTDCQIRTQTSENQDGHLEQENHKNVNTLEIDQDEEQSWNEIGDQKCQGFQIRDGGENNILDGISHSHRRKKKYHEDLQLYGSRGDGLREWKGEFERKSQKIYGGYNEGKSFGCSPIRASHIEQRHNVEGTMDTRPASTPQRMQDVVVEQKSREIGENLKETQINEKKCKNNHLVSSTKYEKPTKVQRGMKEDCEHFRREMRLLQEKAKDSRIREVEVEGLAEKLQRRLVDEMDLVFGNKIQLQHNRHNLNSSKDKVCAMHGIIMDSPRMNRLRGGHPPTDQYHETCEVQENESEGAHLSYKSPSATTSGSTSGSSLTSRPPFSHYIQKLKDFSPTSQLGPTNFELLASPNKTTNNQSKVISEDAITLPTSNDLETNVSNILSAPTILSGGCAPMIFLPNSTNSSNSSHGLSCQPLPQLVTNQLESRKPSSLYTSLAYPTQVLSNIEDGGPTTVTTINDQFLHSHFRSGNEGDKMNNIQNILGELKGSVEGIKICMEVDGQGWKGRVEVLEKELEILKEEADDEIIAAKHSLRNEMKVKLGNLMAEMEKLRRHERDEVIVMVEERIEKQLQVQKDTKSSGEMKDEIRLLWEEVGALVKSKEEMQGHVEHLSSLAQKTQEQANQEQEMLKSENGYLRKQLQSLKNDGVQIRLETKDFRVEKEDLRLAMDKLRGEGSDMKLEIQSLKKVEKLLKMEIENIRIGLAKLQEETQGLELQNGTLQLEGGRERLLIIERIESLSQLYLSGLEEVKADVFNVKFNCRDQIQDFENQMKEFKKQQLEGSTFASKKMLLDELDHFRGEIAEMVEMERGLLKKTLECESEAVQCQVKDLLISNKGDIINVLKLDVQKWLQSTHEKAFLMSEALKQELEIFKNDFGQMQERAEDLIQIISTAEIQKDVATAAAVDASMSATKASNALTDLTTSINHEMTDVRYKLKQFQENLTAKNDSVVVAMSQAQKVSQELQKEKDVALITIQEVRQKHLELQDCLERESPRLMTTLMEVQKEHDSASQAALDATSSAAKAREALAEILESYKLEMIKAKHIRTQLQEELEIEKARFDTERELAIKHSHNAQDHFSEELQLAIDDWKRAMNAEILKAKEVTNELEKQFKWRCDPDHPNFQLSWKNHTDLKNYISKMEESINGLATIVKELQDYKEHFMEEKKRRSLLKQHENEIKDQHFKGEISQMIQIVRGVEKRVFDVCGDYTEVKKRLKKCEGTQIDLVHTIEEVTSTTNELAKTVNNWLLQYDAAAHIVNDLSSKVNRVEERFEGFSCDEGLVQRISQVAETKVESLKELVLSNATMKDIGQELRVLHERVESSDCIHCQAIGEVAMRVKGLEQTASHGAASLLSPTLSLKVEYTNGVENRKPGMGLLNQSVEALEKKIEYTGSLIGGHEPAPDSRLLGLESRIEHVASATFTNLRLLDNKMDQISLGIQSAVEGATLAESKCGALGAELVKVFRMLTASSKNSTNNGNSTSQQQTFNNSQRGQSNSPSIQISNPKFDSCNQSPHNQLTSIIKSNGRRHNFSPKRRSRIFISSSWSKLASTAGQKHGIHRNMAQSEEFNTSKSNTNCDSEMLIARDQAEGESTFSKAFEECRTPTKQSFYYLKPSLHAPVIGCKLHNQGIQLATQERTSPQLKPHSPFKRRHESLEKVGCQNAAICFEAGRIHMNVCHLEPI